MSVIETEGTSKSKPAPKIASIFTAPSKKASTSSSKPEPASISDEKKTDKGKSKADVEDTEDAPSSNVKEGREKASASATNSDEGGEISGVDENGNEEADDSAMESEEEQEQAAKLCVHFDCLGTELQNSHSLYLATFHRAEIFTKKVAGSSKGKYGKGIDWKAGDP